MALGATIVKLTLDVADDDRSYWATHELTLAQHPSEPDVRVVVRIAAFALNAHEGLAFTRGMNVDDEPELWRRSATNEIERWIDFGQLDERRIRKACGRAREVIVYTYAARKAEVWWKAVAPKLERFDNLSVVHLDDAGLGALYGRNLHLQASVDGGELHLDDGVTGVTVVPRRRG